MGPFDASWLDATVLLATPLLLAAIGELFSERAGVLNVGLEGMILMGAFWAYWGQWWSGSVWFGFFSSIVAGMALAAVMALLSVTARADQIVIGVGLNLLAAGLTTFVFREIFGDRGEIVLDRVDRIDIPGLSDIPFFGDALFDQSPMTYFAWFAVVAAAWVLYRTEWGLGLRAVGEVPAAADTAGISVARTRWEAVLVTGAFAGLAGATLSIVDLGLFQEGMSAGRGFLALAAVIFGRWHPGGVLMAALVFGGADALQLRLQAETDIPRQVWMAFVVVAVVVAVVSSWSSLRRDARLGSTVLGVSTAVVVAGLVLFALAPSWSFPSQLWLATPFVVTLVALAGAAGSVRAPAAITIPYLRDRDV